MQEKPREHIEKRVPLTDEEFAFVIAHFTLKKFRKHQFLIQEGEPVPYSFFVVSGLLKLVYTDESSKQHIVSFAMEDWWESDLRAFYTRAKTTMSLDCLEDTVVFCLSLENFHKLCNGLPKFERFSLELSLAGSIAAQQRRSQSSSSWACSLSSIDIKITPWVYHQTGSVCTGPFRSMANWLELAEETGLDPQNR